jgi:hypothetical protein
MVEPLNIGDKIKFVCGFLDGNILATVHKVFPNGNLRVNFKQKPKHLVIHPRQITHRIVKKKKKAPRKFFLVLNPDGTISHGSKSSDSITFHESQTLITVLELL